MTQVETETRQLSFIQAVNEALRQEMERDDRVFVMGEDIAGGAGRPEKEDAWGGPMKLTKGLIGQFGPERVRDTPISEAGFVGAGVGAAATGLRPVVDLMYVGFLGVCADQILNNAAKIHYMFGGKVTVPLTIMTATGAGTSAAAQHSETLYSVFTHFLFEILETNEEPYITSRQLFEKLQTKLTESSDLNPERVTVPNTGGEGFGDFTFILRVEPIPAQGAAGTEG